MPGHYVLLFNSLGPPVC